jgi:NTE family protein
MMPIFTRFFTNRPIRKQVQVHLYCFGKKREIVIEYEDGITLKQVMASGTLPESYDPKEIGGRKFWDSGVLSNTPLKELLYAHRDYWVNVANGEVPDLDIYIVNVHPSRIDVNHMPEQYDEVKDRNNDILYGDRTYNDQYSASLVANLLTTGSETYCINYEAFFVDTLFSNLKE